MPLYDILKYAHSWLRYLLLALLIINILKTLIGWMGKENYSKTDDRLSLFLLITTHTQLLLGLVMYIMWVHAGNIFGNMATTMHTPELRYFAVEHITGMIVAVILITLGRILPKKAANDTHRFKQSFFYFILAFIIIMGMLAAMPAVVPQ